MDITEGSFRLQPAKRERPRYHLLSHLLANPPRRPQITKIGLHLLPRVLTQNLTQQSES